MTTYYVSLTGSGAFDGSSDQSPYSVTQHNAATFLPGDTIYLLGELAGIVVPSSGILGNPIIYRGDYRTWPALLKGASGTLFYINNQSFITVENIEFQVEGSATGILLNGTTDTSILNDVTMRSTATGRPIYLLGNLHTDWQFNRLTIYHGIGLDVDSSNARAAILLWGNSATAGQGGQINDATLVSGAASVANSGSTFIGLAMEDIDGVNISLKNVQGFHTGIRLRDADDNVIAVESCASNGANLDGQGMLVEASSSGNLTQGGLWDGNLEHYHDASSGGGNEIRETIMINHRVNGVNFGSTGSAEGFIRNNTVIHSPTAPAGHGIVVQNGNASTTVTIEYNLITGDTTGTNVQNMAISGTYASVQVDNNCYYTRNNAIVGKLGTTEYQTLALFQAALGADPNTTGDEANATVGDLGVQTYDNLGVAESAIGGSPNISGAVENGDEVTPGAVNGAGARWWLSNNPIGKADRGEQAPLRTAGIGAAQGEEIAFRPTSCSS